MNDPVDNLPSLVRDPARELLRPPPGRLGEGDAARGWFDESAIGTRLPIALDAHGERFAADDVDRLAERILGPIGA